MVVICAASRQHLRSASRRLLVVPRHRLSTYGRRAFAVAGPTAWNSFPDNLQDPIRTLLWTTSSACWKRFCSQRTSAISALDVSRRCALQIYILLTYLLCALCYCPAGIHIYTYSANASISLERDQLHFPHWNRYLNCCWLGLVVVDELQMNSVAQSAIAWIAWYTN